ncbi:hypothetical protein IID19_02080 [Patescibacteria group bacterium]|nr:hypothetical protein [Patescibacteria group bacterium]
MKPFPIILSGLLLLSVFSLIIVYQDRNTEDNISEPSQNPGLAIECTTDSDCFIGGCSSQLCLAKATESDLLSICDYRNEYSCYSQDNCLCKNNKCQWEGTSEFVECVIELVPDRCEGLSDEECRLRTNFQQCAGLSGQEYIKCVATAS